MWLQRAAMHARQQTGVPHWDPCRPLLLLLQRGKDSRSKTPTALFSFSSTVSILELLIKLLEHIDKPSDLLALALLFKSFSKAIIPVHLDHRIIRCAPGDTIVWQHLIDHPHFTRRVRNLIMPGEVSNEDLVETATIPRRIRSSLRTQIDSFRYEEMLLGAISSSMKNLRHFEWDSATKLRTGHEQSPFLSHLFHQFMRSDTVVTFVT
ncbi:hypothetical protein M422DRAFT_267793 [Sphaerobolus stellatus SS14]|uniref:F-box domain-containing protein n=1 Tax=Sphaerobolus stellatus (strain SS14) TaxID=990650 RepID=A0A0C9TLA3_SPHS4|nr:hypothetical protein M422DRAFT_267793 [Sphaerobolus stellatus SS14]